MADPIYLDANATTPLLPEVAEAMFAAARDYTANPASQHSLGRKARRKLEECREGILSLLGAKTTGMTADTLVFTSGGTEANNLALLGIQSEWQKQHPSKSPEHRTRLVVSQIEHPSILQLAQQIDSEEVCYLPALQSGQVDLAPLSAWLEPRTRLVSVMLANSETGVIQPLKEISQKCAAAGVLFHTDAVQAIGKIPVHFGQLGPCALTLTPHKFHGPLGIGGLVLKHGITLLPRQIGGFQQAGLRPGTESVPLAVGFFTALTHYLQHAETLRQQILTLRDDLQNRLLAGEPTAIINGQDAPRLPTTLNIAFPGIDRQKLMLALDMAGVACSTGTACASGSSEPSPVLLAMGLASELVESSLRFSLSALTTPSEIAESAAKILRCVHEIRSRNNR